MLKLATAHDDDDWVISKKIFNGVSWAFLFWTRQMTLATFRRRHVHYSPATSQIAMHRLEMMLSGGRGRAGTPKNNCFHAQTRKKIVFPSGMDVTDTLFKSSGFICLPGWFSNFGLIPNAVYNNTHLLDIDGRMQTILRRVDCFYILRSGI